MKPLSLMLSTCLVLPAFNAGAQVHAYPLTEPGISRVEVMAPTRPFQFRDYEAEAISGAYAMSNGWRMQVDPADDGIVARIDKRPPIRLLAVARDRYVSRDGNVSMAFNRGRLGEDMLMSYVPDERTALAVVARSTLSQR